MPELPEVETVVRTLRPVLCGRQITGVRPGSKKLRVPWRRAWSSALTHGYSIVALHRRGKWLVFELEPKAYLLMHLGMTGRLRVAAAGHAPEPHTHLCFLLEDGQQELRFEDIRRFGSAEFLTPSEVEARLHGAHLGPEPWELTAEQLRQVLERTDRCLKAVLLDQRVIAGVGNIYADEALFEARLHPGRRGVEVTLAESSRLRRAVIKVLERAIEKKGATIRNFFYGENGRGGYQAEFRVYQRTGEPCVRCRTPIARVVLAGRSTHFCPNCQGSNAHGGRGYAPMKRAATGSAR